MSQPWRTVLGCIVALLALLAIVVAVVGLLIRADNHSMFGSRPFDQHVWLAARGKEFTDPTRSPMAHDVMRRHLKRGMTKAVVRQVLGEPDSVRPGRVRRAREEWHYDVGMPPGAWDPCYVVVSFDASGRMMDAQLWQH